MKIASRVSGLSAEAAKFYRNVARCWGVTDEPSLTTLRIACECLDRLRQAQAILQREGLVVADRWGQQRPHPCCQIEKEARAHLLQALRALELDLGADEEGDAALAALRGSRGTKKT